MLKHFLLITFALLLTLPIMAQNFEADWRNIEKLNSQGKYRSALEAADLLYKKADQANAVDVQLKALFHRLQYTQQLEEDGGQKAIDLLRSSLAQEESATFQAVGQHLMGRLLYSFAGNNSRRLSDRTANQEYTANWDTPFAEWSLNALYKTGTQYLLSALEQAQAAKKSLSDLPAIINLGENLEDRLPDLYAALVHATLEELSTGYANLPEPVYAFTPSSELLFLPTQQFVAAQVATKDTAGLSYRRLQIYQQLLDDQSIDRKQRAAYVHTNLKRLEWAHQLTNDTEAYDKALIDFYNQVSRYTGAGMILINRIHLQQNNASLNEDDNRDGDFSKVRALALIDEVLKNHPNTQAEIIARSIQEQIKRPSVSVQLEECLLPRQPNLLYVEYRNTSKLYYRIYKETFDPQKQNRYFQTDDIRKLARREAQFSGSVTLAKNDDYQSHGTEIALPEMAPGQYTLLLSASPDFDEKADVTLAKSLAVSGLATINLINGAQNQLLLVDRNSGAPVAGATIKLYEDYRQNRLGTPTVLTTDQNGMVLLPISNRRYANWLLVAEKGADKYVENVGTNRNRFSKRTRNSVHFFLDRGLYRPGQTVYAKGLAVHYDEQSEPSLIKQENFAVNLVDVNGQNVGTQNVTTDEYGAFNLSFQLPESGLNGRYTLMATLGGSTSLRVEAYKRPRFEVTFDDYKDAVEADQEVTITGHALGFAGPAVSGGRVTYRVVRETVSYWYFYGGGNNVEAVLATGQTETGEDGSFQITFPAKIPQNQSGPSWRRPSYRFMVYADVADQTGETQTAKTSVSLRSKGPMVAIEVPESVDRAKETAPLIPIKFEPTDNANTNLKATVLIQAIRNPSPATVNRYWAIPDRPIISKSDFAKQFPLYAYGKNRPMDEWPLQRNISIPNANLSIQLGEDKDFSVVVDQLPVGYYRITVSYPDGEGGTAKTLGHFALYDSKTGKLPAGKDDLLLADATTVQPGETAHLQLLTQTPITHLLYKWESRKFSSGIQSLGNIEDHRFQHKVTNNDRGSLLFYTAYVRHNRLKNLSQRIQVPWPTKKLELTYETFRDKLRPGEEESWVIRVKDHKGHPISAQLLASMYDASLDAIAPFDWSNELNFYSSYFYIQQPFNSRSFSQSSAYGRLDRGGYQSKRKYSLPSFNFSPLRFGYGFGNPIAYMMEEAEVADMSAPKMMRSSAPAAPQAEDANFGIAADTDDMAKEAASSESNEVQIRTNLGETAFFQPEIRVGANGEATINFTTPEALTKWKLQLFANTTELAFAYDTKEVVTQKELMVLPNAPRFMREGDELVFTAKVSNLSETVMNGQATLEFFDPETDAILTNEVAILDQGPANFNLAAGKSETVKFRLKVAPNSAGLIGYRIIARAGNFSDGEQNVLPILTNRVFLTATKSFFLRPNQKKTVELDALLNAATSQGNIINQGFTFELTNNPAWLAVKALPYLTEYPYDCTEQLVNRFFANQLSYTIVKDKPELQKVYEQWQQDPDALKSPLALNQHLKQAILEETPWLREAQSEEKQQEQLATLFDINRIAKEQESTLAKLEDRQRSDGSFSWFPDGPENVYMTQYVVEALQRLRSLNALDEDKAKRINNLSRNTLSFLDEGWVKRYQELMKQNKKEIAGDYLPATSLVHYLYIRSFYLDEQALSKSAKEMWNFYYGRAKKNWTKYGLYEQALLAATYSRTEPEMGQLIIESLRERALTSEEFGMYWKYPAGWSWQQLPVETHCRIFEAFLLNGASQKELDEMRLYLLQDKRTNRWETTKATAAAVFALLQNGSEWLENDTQVKVSIPGISNQQIAEAQQNAEAGTGQYQIAVAAQDVSSEMGKIKLNNDKKTMAWGGMFWQFTQDIDAVQQHNEHGPLGLSRGIFRRINTEEGERLVAVDATKPVQPGDRLVVQLTIRADRNFEFVHLKDRRASGLEPSEQLSGYRYRSGLGFYFSPDDLAVNFFFDYLPKGTYTLEYDLFVNHAGDFSNGLSVLQSMYAPEFAGYSKGSRLKVE